VLQAHVSVCTGVADPAWETDGTGEQGERGGLSRQARDSSTINPPFVLCGSEVVGSCKQYGISST
jgi:hypothetical protein